MPFLVRSDPWRGPTFELFRARHLRTKPRTFPFVVCLPAMTACSALLLPTIRIGQQKPKDFLVTPHALKMLSQAQPAERGIDDLVKDSGA